MMKIVKLVVGRMATNCYLVSDQKTQQGVIIDPGDDADFIIRQIHDQEIQPKAILATHGHFDHLLAVTELKLAFKIPFLIHQKEQPLVKKMAGSAEYWLGIKTDPVPKIDRMTEEGGKIHFGKEKLTVMETPGHSPGGVSFYDRGVLFSGDTLFKQGVGRTDLDYSSEKDLLNSVKRLFKLPEKTKIYPGHGSGTTIGEEKKQ